MIEIVQAGQADKTALLFDMHRLRARVFKDKLNWDVKVNPEGLEVDQFDLPDTVYLLALDDDRRVIGSWRLLPTTGPTMIADIWPHSLETLPMPRDGNVWEVSRFAIDSLSDNPDKAQAETQKALAEMFCALTELCIKTGIREIYTLYDARIAQVIKRIDCHPARSSDQFDIDGSVCQTGVFKTDAEMLARLRKATGIGTSLIDGIELPQAMKDRLL